MLKRLLLLVLILALGSAGLARAEEKTLSHDDGAVTELVSLEQDAHLTVLESPEAWKSVVAEDISFYGQRYGEVAGLKGTVVIWVPVTPPKIQLHSKYLGALKLLYSKQFDLSSVPDKPGWFTVPVDPVTLPPVCAISLYTYSNDKRGVKVALGTAPTAGRPDSWSSAAHPGTGEPFKFRHDGRDWLLRLKVRDTVQPRVSLDSGQISGPNFSVYDDGTAETFYTFQKRGCLLRCENSAPRQIDAVYVYGKLDGNWIGTTRDAWVLILGEDLKVLGRTKLGFNNYTNVPSWNMVSFPPVTVGKVFYVAFQPSSTPDLKLLVGVDSSGPNRASLFGTSGAIGDWTFDLPQDRTNWMIRARYTK